MFLKAHAGSYTLAIETSNEDQNMVSRLVTDLKRCSKLCDLEQGKKLHEEATTAKLHTNKYIASLLITLYCKSRCMLLARQVFDQVTQPDVVIWNSLILGYVENGNSFTALQLFIRMDCTPSTVTYVAALKACASLGESFPGVSIHGEVERLGYTSDVAVATTLLDMYTKCGSLERAKQLFDRMHYHDVVTWNILLFGYVSNGESRAVTNLLTSMSSKPDSLTYVAVLKACGQMAAENRSDKLSCLERGAAIHKRVDHRLSSEIILANSLIDMYGKCGTVQAARNVFDKMSRRDVVTWNSLITAYTDNEEFLLALEVFSCMSCEPDSVTCLRVLKACRGLAVKNELDKHFCLERGIWVHKLSSKLGFGADLAMPTTLVDMYSKLGTMHHARKVFDGSCHRDTITWNALLLGYVENGESLLAMDLFSRMNIQPDSFTYVAALKATGDLDLDKAFRLEKSVELHKLVLNSSSNVDICLTNTLLDVYCQCGSFHLARKVFESMSHRDVVSWNTLLTRYVESGDCSVAMELFVRMDCDPDCITFVAALKACMGLASETDTRKASRLKIGIAIHKKATDTGLNSDTTVGNTLVEMYSRCGSSTHAREAFDQMTHRNVVAWNSLILGCVDNGEPTLALEIFNSMNLEPDTFTYVAALKACGGLSTLPAGRKVHARVCRLGLEQDHLVLNALMDFYIKCGNLTAAEALFNAMVSPDLVSWNTLITGYSSTGSLSQVLRLANKLEQSDLPMDDVTFTCVLAACSHAGLVKEAKFYFESVLEHGVRLRVEHFNCMVDMLGRGNRLQEALDFINSMPFKPNNVTWMTLLAASRRWNNKQVGQVAFDSLEIGSRDKAVAYVFLSDIYARSGDKSTT